MIDEMYENMVNMYIESNADSMIIDLGPFFELGHELAQEREDKLLMYFEELMLEINSTPDLPKDATVEDAVDWAMIQTRGIFPPELLRVRINEIFGVE